MSRLTHELKGYLAALRMTRTQLIVFIEGKENDPVFYSQVKDRYERETGIVVEIRRAQELPGAAQIKTGGSGGKPWLLRVGEFWRTYRTRTKMSYKCKLLIALDKDIDDIKNNLRTDSVFIYTQGYEVENYLIAGTDVVSAVGKALSLLPHELTAIINPDQESWMNRSINNWFDWLVFCILARLYERADQRSYSKPSAFNRPRHDPVSETKRDAAIADLQADSGTSEIEFSHVRGVVEELVRSKLASGAADTVFKGEWYVEILFSQIEANPHLRDCCVQIGKRGIWAAIRASFTLRDSAYMHYKLAFDLVLS